MVVFALGCRKLRLCPDSVNTVQLETRVHMYVHFFSIEVKRFAGDLLSKWMAIFREGQASMSIGTGSLNYTRL